MNTNSPYRFDELWRQKLQDFGEDPDDGLIEKIQAKKERMMSLYKIISLIAVFLLCGLFGLTLMQDMQSDKQVRLYTPSSSPISGDATSAAPEVSGNAQQSYIQPPLQGENAKTTFNRLHIHTAESKVKITSPIYGSYSINVTIPEDGMVSEPLVSGNKAEFVKEPLKKEETSSCQAGFDYYISYNGELNFLNSSLAPDKLQVEWTFGDGTAAADHNPVHKFARNGNYEVSLSYYENDKLICRTKKEVNFMFYQAESKIQLQGHVYEERFISKNSRVSLYRLNTDNGKYEFAGSVQTDNDGSYHFNGIENGRYLLMAAKAGQEEYQPSWYGDANDMDNAWPIKVNERFRSDELYNINMPRKVSGTAYEPMNDSEDSGSIVYIIDQYNNPIAVHTDGNGNITGNHNLTPGSYPVVNPANGNKSTLNISGGSSGSKIYGSIDDYSNFSSAKSTPAQAVKIIPNPASNDIRFDVSVSSPQKIIIRVLNNAGVEVFSKEQYGNLGNNTVNLIIAGLPAGVYYVSVQQGNSMPSISKFVKNASN